MLSVLHIENIAVIEQAEVRFDRGFNALTGETGAGKSIVIDAISAILGERTYRDCIRTGAKSAFVSAIFTGVPELAWFTDNQVPYDADELQIQREISESGKSACRVNGRPVTAAILRQLGMQLINIHGQHDSQQLFDEEAHLSYLDLFAHDEALLAQYTQAYEQMQRTRAELAHLQMDEGEKLRLLENLRYQIDEITRAEVKAGEETELEARRKFLQNAEKMTAGIARALQALYGGDSSDGAAGLLGDAEHALSALTGADETLSQLHERVSELMYGAQDVVDELRAVQDGLEDSAFELEKIESRLDVLYRLRRKYGATTQDILDYLARAQQQLDEIEFSDERREQLAQQLEKETALAQERAAQLRAARQAAAEKLQERMERELAQLDMPKVRFCCQFEETALSAQGGDAVRFLMSANVGEALKPLSKVASGGELARIMLAIKNVMAEQDAVPTLIFDEVDAGVSGRAAQKVAEKLASVARHKQVLCVTHLPQIAAMADVHFAVEKRVENGRTFTHVTQLDRAQRRAELARLTSGGDATETMLAGAEELLAAAERYKSGA